jgi:hypothetical protein
MPDLTITLPLPPRELSPNHRSRSHWGRTRATKIYRAIACDLATLAARQRNDLPWDRVQVQATFYFTANLGRDGDNFNAMLKPALDALQPNRSTARSSKPGAGIVVNDKHVTLLPPVFEVDKLNPRVVLTITQLESEAGSE